MGDGIWTSTDAPWGSEVIGSLISGVEIVAPNESGKTARSVLSDDGALTNALYQFTKDQPFAGNEYTEDSKTRRALDFGVFREAVLNTTRGSVPTSNTDGQDNWNNDHVKYWRGPWVRAARIVNGLWENSLSRQQSLDAGTPPNLPIGDAVKSVALLDSVDDLISKLVGNTTIWGTQVGNVADLDNALAKFNATIGSSSLISQLMTAAFPAAFTHAAAGTPTASFDAFGWGEDEASVFPSPSVAHGATVSGPATLEAGTVTATAVTAPTDVVAGVVETDGVDLSTHGVDAPSVAADAIPAPDAVEAQDVAAQAVAGTVTAAAITLETPIAAAEIAAPQAVSMANQIDAAVAAHAAAQEIRFAQERAALRASLLSGRVVMTTAFDHAQALLAAGQQAQLAEFESGLRVEQARLQAQADLAHQGNLLERNTRNATLSLDAAKTNATLSLEAAKTNAALALEADKANLDAAVSDAGLKLDAAKMSMGTLFETLRANAVNALEAAKTGAALAVDAGKANLGAAVSDAGLKLDAAKTGATLGLDAGKTNAELFLDAAKAHAGLNLDAAKTKAALDLDAAKAKAGLTLDAAKAEAGYLLESSRANAENEVRLGGLRIQMHDANIRAGLGQAELTLRHGLAGFETGVRARTDLLRMIYDTTIAWMNAKANLVTNAGPLASVINTASELSVKSKELDRNAYLAYLNHATEQARAISGGYEGMAQLRWKAMIQNMMVLKEAVSSFQGIGGVEHHPSGFEKAAQSLSFGTGLASLGINLGMILG